MYSLTVYNQEGEPIDFIYANTIDEAMLCKQELEVDGDTVMIGVVL